MARGDGQLSSVFEGLQVGDHVAHLPRIEPELRHGWMAGDNSFCERLLEELIG